MEREQLDEWAEWMSAVGSSAKTVRTRVQGVEGLARHAGLADPAAVTTRQIVAWLAVDRSPWTRLTYWYSAQGWGAFLADRGYRSSNPAEPIPRPRSPRSAPRPVDDAAVGRMLDHPTSSRAYAYTVLAVFAGLRVHEIAQIRGEDVQNGRLYVRGKGGGSASIPVHSRIVALAVGMPAAGYWFRGAMNGHVRPRSVSMTLSLSLRAAGSSAAPHALRHSYGTALMRKSRNLRVTQALMRHQSVSATQIYTHVAEREEVAAIGQLEWGSAA